ncbi:MAG TPA: phosphoglycerate kinase [Xanthobacteraceae bacterium]|nr:phosphoglycerate kinase [Xanthobacteraceae bacterium]
MPGFHTLDEANVKGKRVLIRVDLNVPMEAGHVADDTRIRAVAPTIRSVIERGGKAILLSHFGRPKGPDASQSLAPVAPAVAGIIGKPVAFAGDCVGPEAEKAVAAMKPGNVLLLENTRFHSDEEKNAPRFVNELAKLGDIYVNDAFSTAHRAHASTEGLAHKLPAFVGRTMQHEIDALTRAFAAPERPLAAIVGGAKVSSKLALLHNLLAKVEILVIGGAMANTFLAAEKKPVGKSLIEADLTGTALKILASAKETGCEIVLPSDAVVAKKFEANAPSRAVSIEAVGADEMILDIGPKSVAAILAKLARVRTLVWNGPMGAFELPPFDAGTKALAKGVAELTAKGKLHSFAGGGDTLAALHHAGVIEKFTYVSTAGGAFLEWLEGKPLPGVEALRIQ